MKLSDFKQFIEVAKDGEFDFIGTSKRRVKNILVFIENDKMLKQCLEKDNITCVVTTKEIAEKIDNDWGVAVAEFPRKSFYDIHSHLYETGFYKRDIKGSIDPSSEIHSTAVIESNVVIGKNCKIGPNVVILENTIIGDDVVIRPGVVIGTQGFSFFRHDGTVIPVAHGGGVKIGDRVEIQANSCISKGIFEDDTVIGDDCKFDNLVHIAHSVVIGKRCFFAANAMVAGVVEIGDDVWVGPCACISSGINIPDKAGVSLGAVVTKDPKPGQKVSGNFAIDHDKFLGFIKDISA